MEKPVLKDGLCNQALGLIFHTTGREPLAVFLVFLDDKLREDWLFITRRIATRVYLSFAALAWHQLFLLIDVTSVWHPLPVQSCLIHIKKLLW